MNEASDKFNQSRENALAHSLTPSSIVHSLLQSGLGALLSAAQTTDDALLTLQRVTLLHNNVSSIHDCLCYINKSRTSAPHLSPWTQQHGLFCIRTCHFIYTPPPTQVACYWSCNYTVVFCLTVC